MKLTTENVSNVFTNCLFTEFESEDSVLLSKALISEGVNLKVGFHPDRIKQNKENIISMLDCLPDAFKSGKGGGWSFLNMIEDKNGVQWTSLHAEVDKLLTLGVAVDVMTFLMPRDSWKLFPGGVPYLVITNLRELRKEKLEKIEKN